MARVQIAAATLSGNSLRQTVHTLRASVHQAAKLVAALFRVAGLTTGLTENNGSLHPDCQEPASAPDRKPTLGNRVWATFLLASVLYRALKVGRSASTVYGACCSRAQFLSTEIISEAIADTSQRCAFCR